MAKKVGKTPSKRIRAGVVTLEQIREIAESVGEALQQLRSNCEIMERRKLPQVFVDGCLMGEDAKNRLATFASNINKAILHGRTE